MFHLKRNLTTTHEPLHAQNETNGNTEFLQPYSVVAADALFEIGTAVISAVLSLNEILSQTNTFRVPTFCYQSVYCIVRCFLVGIRIATCFTNSSKRFRCEVMFENVYTRSTRDYTTFAHAQLLRNWREQRPSSQGDLDSSVTGEIGRVCYTGVELLLKFLYRST
jgi:hypothetical protein